MSGGYARLTLRSHLDELSRLAEVFERFCEAHEVPAASRVAVNVALEEIVTNIISYAYDGPADRGIDIDLLLREGLLKATVADDGRPYDPLQHPAPDVNVPLDERRVGGLGILLMKQLVDDVRYERSSGRNVLTLVKRV